MQKELFCNYHTKKKATYNTSKQQATRSHCAVSKSALPNITNLSKLSKDFTQHLPFYTAYWASHADITQRPTSFHCTSASVQHSSLTYSTFIIYSQILVSFACILKIFAPITASTLIFLKYVPLSTQFFPYSFHCFATDMLVHDLFLKAKDSLYSEQWNLPCSFSNPYSC